MPDYYVSKTQAKISGWQSWKGNLNDVLPNKVRANMYNYKNKYTIDFREVKYYLEMHLVIRDALDFPDYYGCSWDAFWDCLTDMITLDGKLHIEIIGLDIIKEKFDDSADMILKILKRFKHFGNSKYAEQIKIDIILGDNKISLS